MFQKYYEMGLSVIPLKKSSKFPVEGLDAADFTRWADERQPESLIELYSRKYPTKDGWGIAVVTGKISGVTVIDIDSESRDIIEVVPPSPIRRRGRRYESRFFKYNSEINSCAIKRENQCDVDKHIFDKEGIDVLNNGKYIVIPPSIHPETKNPFIWTTPDTLENFHVSDLPEISSSVIDSFYEAIKEPGSNAKIELIGPFKHPTGERCPHESHNRIKRKLFLTMGKASSLDELVNSLIKYDEEQHHPTYFEDKSRSECKADKYSNALKFVANNIHYVNRRRAREGLPPELPFQVYLPTDPKEVKEDKFIERSYPETTGILGKIQQLIIDKAESTAPHLALGGAISIMSALCANKYRFDDIWCNTYILNLAPTGTGKSFPFFIAKDLLIKKLRTEYIRGAGAQSGSGLTKNLISNPNRLELIDEVGSFFNKMKSGGVFQTEMVDVLCDLWSTSNSLYLSPAYSEKEDTASCFNPCVNILAATTQEGFKNSVDKMMIMKGLIPRFLSFIHYGYGESKKGFYNEDLAKEIAKDLKPIVALPYRREASGDKMRGDLFNPYNVATVESSNELEKIREEFYKMLESNASNSRKEFLTRGKEIIAKLATLRCISENRSEASVGDIRWGKLVFLTSLENMIPLLDSIASEGSQFERDRVRVVEILRHKGSEKQSDLLRSTKIPSDRLSKVIEFLHASNQIEIKSERTTGSGRSKTVYYWV